MFLPRRIVFPVHSDNPIIYASSVPRIPRDSYAKAGRKQKSKISLGKHKKGDTALGDPTLTLQYTEHMSPALTGHPVGKVGEGSAGGISSGPY